jgi:hypothetical protein
MPVNRPWHTRGTTSVGGSSVPGRYVVVAPVIGLIAAAAPLVAAGVVGAIAVLAAAVASPVSVILASALLTTAIPKAGFLVNGLPLPLMMFVLLMAAVMLRGYSAPEETRGRRLALAALAWLGIRLVVTRLDGGSAADVLALAGWYGLPLLLLLVGPGLGAVGDDLGRRWVRRLETGMLIACGFSVVQQLAGIVATTVPGVTRAVGADYSAKPLVFEGGTKIPSTYQNGNVLGVITAFFFLVAADRVLAGRGSRRDGLIMAGTAVATVLSGSRTVVIGLAVGVIALLLRSGLNRRTIAVCVLVAAALVGVLQWSPALSDRLLGTRTSDPALEVRTVVWGDILRTTPVAELLVGGPVWAQDRPEPGLAEGALGAIQQVGILGMALFAAVIMAATNAPGLRRWRLLLIPVAVSFAVDSAYLVFPTLFIPLARMFAPLHPETPSSPDEPAGASTVEPFSVPA